MMTMQATEEEYRALYPLLKAFDEKFPGAHNPDTTPGARPTAEARAAFDQQIRTALRPERFADWESSVQIHATTLARLALANNLPPQTVRDMNALMTATAASSWRIAQDSALTSEQRAAALGRLAHDTRTQVSSHLGATTATTYLRDVFWIDTIANGGAVRLSSEGISIRTSNARPPVAPVPPRN
eukprot:gene51374-biopygen41278